MNRQYQFSEFLTRLLPFALNDTWTGLLWLPGAQGDEAISVDADVLKHHHGNPTLLARTVAWSLRSFLCLWVIIFLLMLTPLLMAEGIRPESQNQGQLRIAIHCSRNLLQLWIGPNLLREYPVHTGKGGIYKRRSGDHRTPIGEYEITWMASRDSHKGHSIVDGRSWCRDNRFVDAPTGPPLEKLWSDSYGGDEASIMSLNYPNEKDRQRGYTGDCIHIHSDKHLIDGALRKSFGCIHMFPQDARELYEMVAVGTPVKIFP